MAPTNADARDTCMEGETGLITMFPHEFISYNRSLGEAIHIMGGRVKAIGSEEPKRWNGPQWSMLWGDELALCNKDSFDQAQMGLRLGDRPYMVCTTTPKNKKWVKALAMEKTTYVPQYIDAETGRYRLPTTFDNKYLPGRRVDFLKRKYGGSRLGRQELDGVFIEDVDGAVFKRKWFRYATDKADWPRFERTYVAIDPAGSAARKKADENSMTEQQKLDQIKNADTAISVVSVGSNGRMYVRAIIAGQWSPKEWALHAVKLFYKYNADKIIAERNYGGDMVEDNIRTLNVYDHEDRRRYNGRYLPIETVVASKGKHIRAQPVATLYEQGRVIHCSTAFGHAEDQMCAFIDADDNEGADMVDAIVWNIIKLAELDIALSGSAISVPASGSSLTKMKKSPIVTPHQHSMIVLPGSRHIGQRQGFII
jgi:phage terminase large subunit-like protein